MTKETKKELTGYPSIDKPWLKYYSEEAINAPLPECSIYEYMYENNKDYSSDIAINYMGRKITYGELFESIDKTAAAFIKAGVKEKEIVTVALPSIPEALYCVYALNKIGAVANMIHPLAGKEETINYINEVKSRVVVIFDKAYEAIADSVSDTTVEKIIVASPKDELPFALKTAYSIKVRSPKLDGKVFCSWKSFIKEGKGTEVKAVDRNCQEMAIISHTGGTTGEPKGVMCSDFNVNTLIQSIVCNDLHERGGKCLAVLPPFINYSLINSMLEMLVIGFEVILIPNYEPLELGKYITKYRPTIILSIPAYWEALLRISNIEATDMSSLRYLYYGGEAMSPETEEEVNHLLRLCGAKAKLRKGLGSTEMMAAATQTYEDVNMKGSAGIPLICVNQGIFEPETEAEVSYSEEGEICFSGPTLMMGYFDKPEETDEVVKVHSDGKRWLHTGDLGYITEDGVLFITGRIKRIIMTKGEDGQATKMFPDRIEKAINKHPSVFLSCVIGIKDADRINYPKAFVELKPECEATEELKIEIIQHCKEELPDYMVPVEIEYISEMPRTSRGKVDYRALEEL